MSATTVGTTLYTAQTATPMRTGCLDKGGRERVIVVPYMSTAIEAASTINVCTLPAGAILTGIVADCEAQDTGATLALLYGATTVLAATAIDTAAGDILKANVQAFDGAPSTVATKVSALTGGATLLADKAIVFKVRYVLD